MDKPIGKIDRAKLFMHGRSQAVRLPKEFRMPGSEVEISREGDRVILSPVRQPALDWQEVFARLDAMGPIDEFLEDRYEGLTPPREIDFDV